MSRRSRPRFYARQKLERKARRMRGWVALKASVTDRNGKTVHLGPGVVVLGKRPA